MRITVSNTASFGGLAAAGVNARFKTTPDGLAITRSFGDLIIVSVVLIGFAVGPLFALGSEELELLMKGDFGGERWFLLIFEPFILLVSVLFIRSNIARRPKATVTRNDGYIRYTHPGYDNAQIQASEIEHIYVGEKRMSSADEGHSKRYSTAAVRLRDGNAIAIASNARKAKMQELAQHISAVLSVPLNSTTSS